MKQLLSYLLCVCIVCCTSCQKEVESQLADNEQPGETPDGDKLTRIVFKYADTDSAYTDLLYDAANRWIGNKANDDPVLNDYVQTTVYRSADGVAYRFAALNDATPGSEDSTVYRVEYDRSNSRYTAKMRVDNTTEKTIDSTAYDYDSQNRITTAHLFARLSAADPFKEQARAEFTYSNSGNLTGLRSLISDPQSGAGLVPIQETLFSYDVKVNPLILGMEGVVMDQLFFVSPNNITSLTMKDLTNPGSTDEVLEFSYQYHPSNKPKSGQLKSGAIPVPMFFRYR